MRVLRRGLLHGLRAARDPAAEILRHPDGVVAENFRQHHVAHGVAEMRGVVKIPRVVRDGALREVPVVRDLGQRLPVALQLLRVDLLPLPAVDRREDHRQPDAALVAEVADLLDGLHAGVDLPEIRRLIVAGEVRAVACLVPGEVADVLHVAHALVVAAALHVKDVEDLRQQRVGGAGAQLFQ